MLFFGAGCGAGDADRDAGIAGPNSTVRSGEAGRERSADDRPNIVFVMTDDMEEKMLSRMPVVRSRMMGEDVTYRRRLRHPVSVRPSRATALRGQYPHNHRITASDVPDGGAVRFQRRGLDESTFATWLQDSGYHTGLVGKYLNNTEKHYIPAGWDE